MGKNKLFAQIIFKNGHIDILDNSVKITQSKIIPEKFCFSPEKKPTARTGRVLLFISSIIVREQLILFVFFSISQKLKFVRS